MWWSDMGYIDIHSHIICGIDDGPTTMELSEKMLQKAYDEGFTTIIATPHCSKGFKRYSKEDVMKQCETLDRYAKEHIFSEFNVVPGQEIYYNEASLRRIQAEEVIPLGTSNYILLEFDPDVPFSHMLKALREVSMSTYFVVLAHIERYACLYNTKNLLEIRQMGILTQMNYADIGGKWYQKSTAFCRKCLRNGLVDFLGTDMHDDALRASQAVSAFDWMSKNLDADYIKHITETNANDILFTNKG